MSPETAHERLKDLLAETLDRSPEERGEFLSEACGDDDELRQRVEALLKAHEGARDFLSTRTRTTGEAPGMQVGRYKLLQEIGEGGFGSVWMAEQLEPVRRKVALKIIKLGMDTKQVVARFEAERQALALMDHPNIAKVLDGGMTESGRPFFVMELVRGVPITEYCDEARLSTSARLELFLSVCNAVQHAHQKGIIHRDIKPSNVLVTLHDGRPVPMVIDFGIAKATSGSLTEKTLFTEFRQFIGTPEYMSPEQAEISGLDVDTRADIYSLGVLLYELLTGTTPLDPHTLRTAAYAEVIRLIREVEPQRPSTRVSTLGNRRMSVARARATEPGVLPRLMRGDLDWIVMKALEKERTRRYESASSFAQDVHRYLTHEPVVARPPSRAYRMVKFVRRNRVVVTAAALVVGALLTGTTAATIGFVRAEHRRMEALAARERAHEARKLAEVKADHARAAEREAIEERERATAAAEAAASINAFYDDMLLALDPQRLRERSAFALEGLRALATAPALDRETSALEMLRGASAAVDARFAEKPELVARVRETLGVTLLGFGRPEEAERELALAAETLAGMPVASEGDRLRIELLRARASIDMGARRDAEERARRALAGMRDLHGPEDARTLHAATELGRILVLTGDYEAATSTLLAALEVQRHALGDEHRDTIDTIDALGDAHLWQGEVEEAAPYVREAVELARATLDENDLVRIDAEEGIGILLEMELNFSRAEPILRSVLEKRRKLSGSRHWQAAVPAFHLSRCLQETEDPTERAELLREAVDTMRGLDMNSVFTSIMLRDLSQLEFELGNPDEGVRIAKEYADTSLAREGPRSPRTREAVWFLDAALKRVGRTEDSLEVAYQEVLALVEHTSDPSNFWTCPALGSLCIFLRDCGRLEEARAAWRGCLEVRGTLAQRPEATGIDMLNYGSMWVHPWVSGIEDPEEAIDWIERGLELGAPPDAQLAAWNNLTLAYRLAGQDEAARAAAEMALGMLEEQALGMGATDLIELAWAYVTTSFEDLRDPETAVDLLNDALAEEPTNVFGWSALELALADLGHEEERGAAVARILDEQRALATAFPANPLHLNNYVWYLTLHGGAADELRAAVERFAPKVGDDEGRLNTIGAAYYVLGELEKAVDHLEEADRLNRMRGVKRNRAVDLVFLGLARAELGDEVEARRLADALREALQDPRLGRETRHELAPFVARLLDGSGFHR